MFSMLTILERSFTEIEDRSRDLVLGIPDNLLFARPRRAGNAMTPASVGEYVLRSAAMIEQTFGGLTTRLWDDPFEWTLPEKLANRRGVLEYLDEVRATRTRGFSFFTSDADLGREIPSPERLRPIFAVLLETIARAEHYQGRAFGIFQTLSDEKLSRR